LHLTMTGRWFGASEALSCGFTSSVTDDPWTSAFEILETLEAADAPALARLKAISTHESLHQRLAQERSTNREAWSGGAPSPRDAATQGRRARKG
ncbi:MAG: hypothetical protein L0H31_07915, partial [Nocardioidaceae bacterium]|nr:hypothetical protein [Nocardioidaceae bacterium]